jgi:hypothetical protein
MARSILAADLALLYPECPKDLFLSGLSLSKTLVFESESDRAKLLICAQVELWKTRGVTQALWMACGNCQRLHSGTK